MNLRKEIPHIIGVVLTGGLWIPFWILNISNRAKRKDRLIQSLERSIGYAEVAIDDINELISQLNNLSTPISNMRNLIKISSASLYESRQNSSVTKSTGVIDANTRTGTVGIGVKIGRVGVGGSSSKGKTEGTVKTTALTKVGKDEITKIDKGDFLVSLGSVSFAGSQFSRSTTFDELINFSHSDDRLIFSAKNSEKNWIIVTRDTTEALKEIITVLYNINNMEEAEKVLVQKIPSIKVDLDKKIHKINEDIDALRARIESL